MPKGVLHIRQFLFCLTKPVLFSLPRFFRRCRGCTNSVVALSLKNCLCNRISLKTNDLTETGGENDVPRYQQNGSHACVTKGNITK